MTPKQLEVRWECSRIRSKMEAIVMCENVTIFVSHAGLYPAPL